MEDIWVFTIVGFILLVSILFFLNYMLTYKKKWQNVGKLFSLKFNHVKKVSFSEEIKNFFIIKAYNDTVRLDLILEGQKKGNYWRVYKYILLKDRYQDYKTLVLITTNKDFPICLIRPFNLKTRFFYELLHNIDFSEMEVSDIPSNLLVFCDKKSKDENFERKIKNYSDIFSKDLFFEKIEFNNNSVLFSLNFNSNNILSELEKIENFLDYLTK